MFAMQHKELRSIATPRGQPFGPPLQTGGPTIQVSNLHPHEPKWNKFARTSIELDQG